MPAPFLSLITDDCIANGRDYNAGGARYNTRYIMPTGPGTLADSLAAMKYHVFDHHDVPMASLLKAVRDDFVGHESLRQLLVNKTPKYGNDDEYADAFVTRDLRPALPVDRRPPRPDRLDLPRELPVHDVPRLLRFGLRRHAGWPARLGAGVRRHLARRTARTATARRRSSGRPPAWTTRGAAARC